MALAAGNSAHGNSGSSGSFVVSLSANSDSVILVAVTTNGGPVTSVTSANGETVSFHGSGPTSGTNVCEIWSCVTSSAWTNNDVTVNTTSASFITVDLFEVRGADTANIFDDDASIPDEVTSDPATVSTDLADTMIVGAFRTLAAAATAGSGYTLVSAANFQLLEYEIVTATQTSKTVNLGSSSSNGGVGTAVRAEGAAPAAGLPTLTLMGVGS